MNVTSLLARHDGPALVDGENELDYAGLDDAAAQLAARIGDAAGLRVVVIAPNSPALVVALFAAWRAGAVAVPLNARLREHEITRIVADAEPTVLISVSKHLDYSFRDLVPRLLPRLPSLRACLFVDRAGAVEQELAGRATTDAEPLDPAIAAILYTSGTTGAPKGALVKHLREVDGAAQLAAALELTADDRAVFVIPISHAFGLTNLLATLSTGGTAVLVETTFSLEPMLRALERGGTVLHGSPSLFASLLKARRSGVAGLRTGFVAGAACPPELLEQLDRAGSRILNNYGMTETGAIACCRADDPPARRYATCGRPLAGFEARVEDGELQVRGAPVTPGYHRNPAQTDESFVDGWLRTGDLATIDDDGYVRIAGRAKDVVHVGGFNVVPAEVEGVLALHPDVLEAAVIGVPHERMGEVLQAFIVARPGSELEAAALLRFARPRIAGYKLPYAIRILPKLPVLASGKPDRVALAREFGEATVKT